MEITKFSITPKRPFNFEFVGTLYSRFPIQCVDLYSHNTYERILNLGDKLYLVRVKSIGSVDKPELSIEVIPNIDDKKLIEKKLRWMFGLGDDLESFYKIGLKDKNFAKIIRNFYGLRAPKTPIVFEALIIAITEQQIALPVAITLRKRLVEEYGKSLTIEGKRYYAFPTPEILAKASPNDIKKLKFSLRKSEYIVNVSKMVAQGKLNLEKMKELDTVKIIDILTKIRGLGPWTVEYMMCRGMGRYDALPANDLALRTSVTKYLRRKERVIEKEVREFFEPFGKHRGYAAFYLIYHYAFQKYPKKE